MSRIANFNKVLELQRFSSERSLIQLQIVVNICFKIV